MQYSCGSETRQQYDRAREVDGGRFSDLFRFLDVHVRTLVKR